MATIDELNSFNDFVAKQMTDSACKLKLPELFDLWMLQNMNAEDHAENVVAINASINDFLSGERGTPAGEHSQQLRKQFGLSK